MNNFEVVRQENKDSALAEAGEYLNLLLMENSKKQILLMLSGGSALEIVNYLGNHTLGDNLTISVLDERYSEDPTINNFSQLQKTDFYQEALTAESSFFGTLPRKDETIEMLAARWESNLENWWAENPNGLIIATLGMGADGHTAGIFPYPENPEKFKELFENGGWLTAYDALGKHKYFQRVTANQEFLKLINYGIAFACGTEKKNKLDTVIEKKGEAYEVPALLWHEIANVKIFTDIK
jgi:6-phosphogluconolactonase/glucosamine-6-phosphate isomerase/deaminase